MNKSMEGSRHALLRASVASAASTINEPRTSAIIALLPPAPGVPLDAVEAVQRCAEELSFQVTAASSRRGRTVPESAEPGVAVVKEPELGFEAMTVDLASKAAELRFSCASKLPYLTLHIKDVDRFLSIEIVLLDAATNDLRRFELSNKQSVIRVGPASASLPLALNTGWNLLRLDLPRMARAAFGASQTITTEVTIHGVCRISKVFFSDGLYEDSELPPFLRVIPLSINPAVLARQG